MTHVRQPDHIDQHVGQQVRLRRKKCGLSMKQLAEKIGITHQQIQKYETGTNRIPASRLALIADLLGGTPGEFYAPAPQNGLAETEQASFTHLSDDEQRLLRAFASISSDQAKSALLNIADQMAHPVLSSNLKE